MTPKTASQYAEEKAAEFERFMVSSVEAHDPESLLAWRNARALLLSDIPALKAAEEADINRRGREVGLAIESALTAEPLPSDVRRRLRNRLIYGNPEGMGASNWSRHEWQES